MPTKPKRKARGIVVTIYRYKSWANPYLALVCAGEKFRPALAATVCWRHLHRAGCPRLKPGEVKKVRVIIEEAE